MNTEKMTSLEIHQALEDLSVLRDALDSVPYPLSIFDQQDRLVACSASYRDLHREAFPVNWDRGPLKHADIIRRSYGAKFQGSGVPRKIEAELARHRVGVGFSKDINTFGYWARRVKRLTEAGTVVDFSINIDELVKKSKALAEAKRQMEHQAAHDPLTGLPNRRGLQNFMNLHLDDEGRAIRDISILHVDLDKFKSVNDSFGHDAGDAVLRAASSILRDQVRGSDHVARIGGDEFVIVCLDTVSEADIGGMAQRLVGELAHPIRYKEDSCQIGGSIGIAFCPKGWSFGRILINADLALYEAKREGRGCFAVYSPELRDSFNRNEQIAHDIRNGIASGEFEPHFQPQINAVNGQITGFEALARWNHRKRGLVSPAEFIPAAEEAGLMADIDHAIMSKSFAAMRSWLDAGFDVPQISINISGDRLSQSKTLEEIKWAAENYNLEPSSIGLEILESVLVDDNHMSDFGTGHASISGLRTLSIDRIKIDRSLVSDIHRDEELKTITGAIIGLAKALDIEVLAEGVECEAEQSTLISMGCCYVQGFGIARPMAPGRVEDWLHSYQPRVMKPMSLVK